jgi:hypothetical protein
LKWQKKKEVWASEPIGHLAKGTHVGNVTIGVSHKYHSEMVGELSKFTFGKTTRINARELLSGLSVLVEGKFIITAYCLHPFDLFPETKAEMFNLLLAYINPSQLQNYLFPIECAAIFQLTRNFCAPLSKN